MNLYFLVEGKRTEKKVYPAWIKCLVPELSEVRLFDDVTSNNFFLMSGEGYPHLLDRHLSNALEDFKSVGRYDMFVIAIDTDEEDVDCRVETVLQRVDELGFPRENLRVVPQQCCIESWFLGNKTVVPSQPNSPELIKYRNFYDVRESDPELMPNNDGFRTTQAFHFDYFRKVAADRNFTYSKIRPGQVCDPTYVMQLESRIAANEDMATLNRLFDFLREVRSRIVS